MSTFHVEVFQLAFLIFTRPKLLLSVPTEPKIESSTHQPAIGWNPLAIKRIIPFGGLLYLVEIIVERILPPSSHFNNTIMTIIGGGSSSSQTTQFGISVAALAASSIVTAAVCCKILDAKHKKSTSKWEKKRQEERVGRIRAEQKLREALTKLKKARLDVDVEDTEEDDHVLPLKTLGIVQSPYPKRMGTPRQGALVPSSRGCIQFVQSVPPELLDGIDQYSHLWVIFQFHENTSLATSKKTKIRPPRGGGIKVGMMATRSPHRPNPLGLSLVTIDRWEPSNRKLYIKALDLVDGTPGT